MRESSVNTSIDPAIAAMYAPVETEPFPIPAVPLDKIDPRFYRQVVATPPHIAGEPGTIVVDPANGRIPAMKPEARKRNAALRDELAPGTELPLTAVLALPNIVDAVGGKIPVLTDGSFRRGTDILKALALGAQGVLLGRPVMWGLAAYGEPIYAGLLRQFIAYANEGTVNKGGVFYWAAVKALEKAGWKAEDLDLIEANEAFAAQACAVNRDLGWDVSKVNVNGGAIALGHPIGASGARILVTLLHEMQKRNAKKGLATLCIGGGMGIALTVER